MDEQQAPKTAKGQAEDGLPLEDYDSLIADEIVNKSMELSPEEIEKLCRYETANENRRKLLRHFKAKMGAFAATAANGGREDPPPGEERPEKRRQTEIGTMARENPPPGEERPEQRGQ